MLNGYGDFVKRSKILQTQTVTLIGHWPVRILQSSPPWCVSRHSIGALSSFKNIFLLFKKLYGYHLL